MVNKKSVISILLVHLFTIHFVNAQNILMGNGNISACSGTFYDPGGISYYPINTSYTQTICSGNSQNISLCFTFFSIENSYDFLTIYDGPSTNSPVIGVYTGTNSPGTIISSGTCLTLKFVSDIVVSMPGWKANITCTNELMGNGSAVFCSGNFFDDGGLSNSYSNNANFTKTINSGNGSNLYVLFTQFNLENTFDKLFIYDGSSSASPLLGVFTGTVTPGIINSTGNSLTFVFTSDGSVTYSGWSAFVGCGSITSYSMNNFITNTCSGIFYDSGAGQDYSFNENYVATFCSDNGSTIFFNFLEFSTEANYDFLRIYDGPTVNSPLIGSYSGLTSPGMITSTGNCITLKFTSDNTVNNAGWKAEIFCNQPDIEVKNVRLPEKYCGLSNETVNLEIKNNSLLPIGNFPVSYSLNGNNAIIETFTGTLPSGAESTFTFSTGANSFSAGNNTLRAWAGLANDVNSGNDTSTYYFTTYNAYNPINGNYTLGFETNENSIFQNWVIKDKNQDQFTWGNSIGTSYSGNNCLKKESSVTGDDDWAISDCIEMIGGVTYHLEYYFKNYELLQPCFLEVYYGSSQSTSDMNNLIIQNNIPNDTSYQYVSTFFTPQNNGVYYLGFHAFESSGTSSLRLDNINLSVSPANIQELNDADAINIFPNPTSGNFTLSSPFESAEVEIRSMLGELLEMRKVKKGYSNFNLNKFEEGTYFISVNYDSKIITKKIVLLKK